DAGLCCQVFSRGDRVIHFAVEHLEASRVTILAAKHRHHQDVAGLAERLGLFPVVRAECESAVAIHDRGSILRASSGKRADPRFELHAIRWINHRARTRRRRTDWRRLLWRRTFPPKLRRVLGPLLS